MIAALLTINSVGPSRPCTWQTRFFFGERSLHPCDTVSDITVPPVHVGLKGTMSEHRLTDELITRELRILHSVIPSYIYSGLSAKLSGFDDAAILSLTQAAHAILPSFLELAVDLHFAVRWPNEAMSFRAR